MASTIPDFDPQNVGGNPQEIANRLALIARAARDDINSLSGGPGNEVQVEGFTVETNGQTSFALSQVPADTDDVEMHVNGVLAENGVDFQVSGQAVTWMNVSYTLTIGDRAVFEYQF